jgi:prevent-host-death family protein
VKTISQRELRNSSGAVLRAVAAGETLIVTNNGVPAALLSPVPETTRDRLIVAGQLVPAARRFDSAPLPRRTAPVDGTDELQERDRADRR